MSFEDDLVATVRAVLAGVGPATEIKMFGGLGFLLNGNMVAAASKRGLLLRIGKIHCDDALALPGVRPMVMRGRVLEGYVYVDPPGMTDNAVKTGLELAAAFVQTLPAKKPGQKPTRTRAKPFLESPAR